MIKKLIKILYKNIRLFNNQLRKLKIKNNK